MPQIMFDPTKCIGCGACAEVCQKHVNDSGTHRFLRDLCKGCGKCAEECYGGGQMAQITTANLDDLLDAKVHPERHGDLIVRVGGFSSQFVILRETVQDEIISRYAQA